MSSRLSDTMLTALAPLLWGSTYLVTTEMLPPGRPFTAAALRVLPAGLLLVLACRRLPAPSHWGRLMLLAALNIGLFQALLFVAAYRLPGGLAAVAGATQPLLVLLIAWGLDGRRPLPFTILAGLAGVAGMALLLLAPGTRWDAVGVGAALAGAASMAAGTVLARRWQSGLPVLAFTGWQLLAGGAMLAPVAVLADPPLPPLEAVHWAGYGYLSLAGAVLAYGLWFRGVARLPGATVASLGLLSPLTAVGLGWLVLDQGLDGPALLGMALVLGSVLAVQRSEART